MAPLKRRAKATLAVAMAVICHLPLAAGSSAASVALAGSSRGALDIDDELLCTFDTTVLPEISGMTHSRIHPGIVWAANDSYNGPFLYAVDTSNCRIRATLRLLDVPARDVEALASGVDAKGSNVIWIGDIGDNHDGHPYARIGKLPEPEELVDADVSVETYRVTYPGGSINAEALIAAPDREQLWVITKAGTGGRVFELPSPLAPGKEPMVATPVGTARSNVTDAAMAPDGQHFVVRGYFSAEVFSGQPTGRAQGRFRMPLTLGGEAITWTPDGQSVLVASEGSGELTRVTVPKVLMGRDAGIAAKLPQVAGFDIYPYVRLTALGVGAIVALVAGLVVLVRRRRLRVGRKERFARGRSPLGTPARPPRQAATTDQGTIDPRL